MLASARLEPCNRYSLEPAAAAATSAAGANRRIVTNRPLLLTPAQRVSSHLGRDGCSAAEAVKARHRRGSALSGRVKRWHARPTPRAQAAAVTSAISGIRRRHCWTGATAPSGRLQPSNRHTLKPCATPASGANSTHPSPSARQFRLLLNGLATSELRRMFCSDEVHACDLVREAACR
jgi:hypothetical protein